MRASLFLVSLSLLTACSSSHSGDAFRRDLGSDAPGDAGITPPDMGMDLPVLLHCVSDATCDDHVFCNGVEGCSPGSPAADALGCVPGASPCIGDMLCDETRDLCFDLPPDGGVDTGVRATIRYYDYDTLTYGRLPPPSTASGTTPDTSCLGTPRIPSSSGTASSLSLTVEDFQYLSPAASVPVDWFTGDALPAGLACGAGCTATTASVTGAVTISAVPGAWLSYASHAHMGVDMAHTYVPTLAAHRTATDGATQYVVSQQTLVLIPTLLGVRRVAGTSVLLGGVTDCAGAPVGGLVVRAFRTDGTLVSEPDPPGGPGSATMPAYRYFGDTDLPSSSQYYTNPNNGLYAGVNLPPSTPIRIEAWEDDGTTVRLWACEEILTVADAVSFVDLAPYRSDGPTTCTETRP